MNREGFSLLEVLIGATMLVLIAFGFFQYQSMTTKQVKVVEDQAALARALMAIERDIMKDMSWLPPQDSEDTSKVDGATFSDATKAGLRCYDKSGAPVASCDGYETAIPVYFRKRYYKVQVKDASLDAQSPLNRIPMARVRFRVEYKLNNQVAPPMFFARLMTDTLRY